MTVDSEPNNNSSKLLPSSPKPLIHVLCCPSCPYMCLQESVLIDHVTGAHPEPPSADAGAESVNQLKLYRCKLCDSVSTQKCLMLEHAAVFHGAESRQQEDDLLVVRDLKLPGNYGAPACQEQKTQNSALKQQASPSIATGSRKRKLTVPEKLSTDPSQGPESQPAVRAEADTSIQPLPSLEFHSRNGVAENLNLIRSSSQQQQLVVRQANTSNRQQHQKFLPQQQQNLLQSPSQRTDTTVLAIGNYPATGTTALAISSGLYLPFKLWEAARLTQQQQQQQQQQSAAASSSNSKRSAGRIRRQNRQRAGGARGARGRSHQSSPSLKDPTLDTATVDSEQQRADSPQSQGKTQRQNFTPTQNRQLLKWFCEHSDKPYPTGEDTKALSTLTGLNYAQVKKWFANKRMRSKSTVALTVADGEVDDAAADGGELVIPVPAQPDWEEEAQMREQSDDGNQLQDCEQHLLEESSTA